MPQLEKACGLDLHKDKIVGFISDKEGRQQELKEFGTFTDDLLQIREWLFTNGIGDCAGGKHGSLLDRSLQCVNGSGDQRSCF